MDVTSVDGLTPTEDYNFEKDIVFFNETQETASVKLSKDYFALLLTHDAHRPQMNTGSTSKTVKKVVVKILAV